MSTLNPILAGSAQSIEAYQQAIEQTSQAVVQWLKQPEMYQGKSVDELRERISLISTNRVWVTRRRLNVRSSTS
jgi:L-2,4-diaminobutyrate decarboxylase